MTQNKELRKVPASRASRAAQLGGLFTRVASNVALQGSKQLLSGTRPNLQSLLLTPKNIGHLADKLATMRGAAMKLGQLLSMDSGDILSPELSDILTRLRDNAHAMPHKQLVGVLAQNWGKDWVDNFAYFDLKPYACASIGQVHLAHDDSGKKLAVKIQYPGVRDSINSDVDNLGSLLKLTGILPDQVDLSELLSATKAQLAAEANYEQEAEFISLFVAHLDSAIFQLPTVHTLSNKNILVMGFIDGVPIETIGEMDQAERNWVVEHLFRLLFDELFKFKLMQTDPNFANYVYCTTSKKIGLLDFGATRRIGEQISQGYLGLFTALMAQSRDEVIQAAEQIGFFKQDIDADYLSQILGLFDIATMPLRTNEVYDFGKCELANTLKVRAMSMNKRKDQWHTPPVDALFIHRKIAGLYLLAKKLDAQVNVHQLFKRHVLTS